MKKSKVCLQINFLHLHCSRSLSDVFLKQSSRTDVACHFFALKKNRLDNEMMALMSLIDFFHWLLFASLEIVKAVFEESHIRQ
jgi:hypothetical protein